MRGIPWGVEEMDGARNGDLCMRIHPSPLE